MTSAQKKQWVAALRSGTYKQAHGQLKKWLVAGSAEAVTSITPSAYLGHCCLGVAQDLLKLAVPNQFFISADFLPQNVQEVLSSMNDGVGKFTSHKRTFDEIASYIETNIPAVG